MLFVDVVVVVFTCCAALHVDMLALCMFDIFSSSSAKQDSASRPDEKVIVFLLFCVSLVLTSGLLVFRCLLHAEVLMLVFVDLGWQVLSTMQSKEIPLYANDRVARAGHRRRHRDGDRGDE